MRPFSIVETNGILSLPSARVNASSHELGWHALFVSSQVETPFDGIFEAPDTLIVLFRDGATGTDRRAGRGTYREAPPGSLRIVPGRSKLELTLTSTSQTVHLYVRRQIIEEVALDMIDGDPKALEILPVLTLAEPALFRLIDAAEAAVLAGEEESLYSDCLARAIAARLVQAHSGATLKRFFPNVSGRPVSREVSMAIDYMHSHIDQNIGLVDLARACDRSPSHLSRLFGTQMGSPPHRYLMEMRVAKARQMLERTNISIAEIAVICGFTHQEHLTRLFRRYHQATPGAYRALLRT